MVWKLGKHQRSKQRCLDLCWKVHDRAQSFVLRSYTMHKLRTNTFLLVSSSVRSKQLSCIVHGQGQKREQKHTTKKFVGFHNHSPLLTMLRDNRDNGNWTIIVEVRFYTLFKHRSYPGRFPFCWINPCDNMTL